MSTLEAMKMLKRSNASPLPGKYAKALWRLLCFLVLSLTYGLGLGVSEARAVTEAIVFLRDGNLWIMDRDGANQRQLTTQPVGHVSVSQNGKIVFDRFSPWEGLTDRNLYYLDPARGNEIRQLTHDHESITPAISPDGTQVAFQKFHWAGHPTWEGAGRGLWLMDVTTGRHELLVTVASVPEAIQRERNTLQTQLRRPFLDETKWRKDDDLRWVPDSRQVMFSRQYEHGGGVTFLVTPQDRPHPITLPTQFMRALDGRGTDILAFDNSSFSLFLYDTRSGRASLLADQVFVHAANFSPDGQEIAAFVKDQRANLPSLWIMKRNGQEKRALRVSARVEEVAWSLDGRQVLFTRRAAAMEIWTIDTNGSHLKKLAANASHPIVVLLDTVFPTPDKVGARRAVNKPTPPGVSDGTPRDTIDPVPPSIYVDEGACPFECCTYRKWIVEEQTRLFELKDAASLVVATLRPFEVVNARTGVVLTRPGTLKVMRDHERFKKGEVVYVLTYKGEGIYKVWHRGQVVDADVGVLVYRQKQCQKPSAECWGELETTPQSIWWIQIETSTGQSGWTNQPEHFSHADACG